MYNPFGAQTYNLQSSISSTVEEITLTSFLEPVTNIPYTMDLLNTTIAFGTIAPKTSQSEFISFSGITQNADGTATLTGVTRGLAKKYPFTEDSAYKLPHSGQSQFIISDAPQVFEQFAGLTKDNAFTGDNTVPNPVSAQSIVPRDWILALINGGPISINSVVEDGVAGETLTGGELVYYLSGEPAHWLKTDGTDISTLLNVKLGIALGAAVEDDPIPGGVLTYGSFVTSGLSDGEVLFASNTPGAISNSSGDVPRVVAIARNSTNLYFDPNFQNELYNYAEDSVGSDAYAITLSSAFDSYFEGMEVNFKAGAANTGHCTIAINGQSAKTLTKNGGQDLETGDILFGQIVTAIYDGGNFQVTSLLSQQINNVQTFDGNGTWVKPGFGTFAFVQVWGAGASGGTSIVGESAAAGGGGAYQEALLPLSLLGSTEAVTVGAGGAAQVTPDIDGNNGGHSSFGNFIFAYGGGAGGAGSASDAGGGGGGGINSTGSSTAGAGAGGEGGGPLGGSTAGPGESIYGGGIGGAGDNAPGVFAMFGGGGGGGNGGNGSNDGGIGGNSEYGGAGGGGGGSITNGAAGGNSTFGGAGGVGGHDAVAGTAGSVPGGGGGGGGGTGTSGAGGNGRVIITVT